MMAKFVHLVKKYQLRCRDAEGGYMFEERPELHGILNVPSMDNEVSPSIIYLEDDNVPAFTRRCNCRGSLRHQIVTSLVNIQIDRIETQRSFAS